MVRRIVEDTCGIEHKLLQVVWVMKVFGLVYERKVDLGQQNYETCFLVTDVLLCMSGEHFAFCISIVLNTL